MFVYLIALVSIGLGAIAQYFLKLGVAGLDFSQGAAWRAVVSLVNWAFLSGLVCYGASLVFWLYVLSRLELSKAYPLVGIGYVLSLFIGHWLLGEEINMLRIGGVVLIIGGVVCITQS